MAKSLATLVAERLIHLKVMKFQPNSPFLWSNGWTSPIYCDDRRILSYPKERDFIKLEMSRVVAENFPEADVIAGIAINAICHGLLVAHQLSLPFVYVYPRPKDHGLENQIEGDVRPNQKVVIIENQINIGVNTMRVIEALRASGCKVLGIVTLLDYELQEAADRLEYAGVPKVALTTFSDIVQTAKEQHYFSDEDIRILNEWHSRPKKWSK